MSLTVDQFTAELESGQYAWPGGYQRRFIMADGESLCFACAEKEKTQIVAEIQADGFDAQWTPVVAEILWEGSPEHCAHCNAEIPSAYGEPEEPETAAELGKAPEATESPPSGSERPLIQQFAHCFAALMNCDESGNEKWRDIWAERILVLASENLPSGSGFDNGSEFSLDESRPDRLIFSTSFHHMDENGFYDGWTEHRVIVTPSFVHGFDVKVTGRDKRQIKDYIGDCFHDALSRPVPMPEFESR
jgi:hypothetical protein